MRTGPHPLSVYLTYAAQSHALRALASGEEMGDAVKFMVEGVQKYHSYGSLPVMEPLKSCWSKGSVRLLHVPLQNAAQEQGKKPLLLVPSLINRYNIFDLHPDRSFVRWFVEQGHVVYVLDWGDLCSDDQQDSMDALIRDRLLEAVMFLSDLHGVPHIDALGYCMGGTLLCGGVSLKPDLFDRLVFLATPWDFSVPDDVLVQNMRTWSSSALSHIHAGRALPHSLIQSLFAGIYPRQVVEKFVRFLHMDDSSQEAELFVATEDWLNNGVDLPADVARCCIKDWYGQNLTGQGQWSLGDHVVDPKALQHRCLVVASKEDRLVSYKSASALMKDLQHCEELDPSCGHIGMMCGCSTIESVWKPISSWLGS